MEAILTFILITFKHPAFHASLLASCIAIVGIKKTRQSAREKNSIDFETTYKTNTKLVEAWDKLLPVLNNYSTSEIESIAFAVQSEKYNSISLILNTWERAANGIFYNVYDGLFLYKTYGSTVIKLYEQLYPFIVARQSHNPRFYVGLTRLYISWKIKRQSEDDNKVDRELISLYKSLKKHAQ